jgi:hypothetical protein
VPLDIYIHSQCGAVVVREVKETRRFLSSVRAAKKRRERESKFASSSSLWPQAALIKLRARVLAPARRTPKMYNKIQSGEREYLVLHVGRKRRGAPSIRSALFTAAALCSHQEAKENDHVHPSSCMQRASFA